MAEDSTEFVACFRCSAVIKTTSRYCKQCGATQQSAEPLFVDKNIINALVAFYLIELLVCGILTFSDDFRGLEYLLVADGIMALSAILFTLLIRQDVFPVLKWNNFSFRKLLVYTGIAIASSVVVQFVSKWINVSLFDTDNNYYYAFIGYKHPALYMLLVTAVAPALFEELAYRGYVLGALLKLVERRQAIFISAFVFALIHLNMISFVWLLPFALFLGYIRIKENSLWYGIMFHFTFNAVSCLFELWELGIV